MRTLAFLFIFLASSCNVLEWISGSSKSGGSAFYESNDHDNTQVGTATKVSYPSISMVYAQNYAIENLALNKNGTVVSASVSPALPAGLSISNDGTIFGTATLTSPETTYTITLNNSHSVSINIAVIDAYIVNSSATADDISPGDGVCETGASNGICTLKAAISESNNAAATKDIYIPNGTYNTDVTYTISKAYSLNGASDAGVIIDGSAGGFRGFSFAPTSGGSNIRFTNLTLQNFSPSGSGGALALDNANIGVVKLTNVSFKNNAVSSAGASAGAIRINAASSTVHILNSSFVSNSNSNATSFGGAINIFNGSVIIKDTLFFNNSCQTAGGNGGAVSVRGGSLDVDRSLFSANTGQDGGAIHLSAGASTVNINNSTFHSNTSDNGGAIFASTGTLNITNSTFISNTVTLANTGAAVNGTGSTLTVKASIFALNIDTSDSDTCLNVIDGGFNHDDGTTCSWSASGGTNSANLNLGPLADNGGATQTVPLQAGSPAINMGVTGCTNDQRNYSRTDGSCDAGAFEL
jgi:hypothetical protein